jgi:hypothetical protein
MTSLLIEQQVEQARAGNKVHILEIDLAKNVFLLHGVDRKGGAVLARRVRREQLLKVSLANWSRASSASKRPPAQNSRIRLADP